MFCSGFQLIFMQELQHFADSVFVICRLRYIIGFAFQLGYCILHGNIVGAVIEQRHIVMPVADNCNILSF